MIERLYQQVSSLSPRRLILGYSGGVDSQVLLQLLYRLKEQNQDFPEVLAVHVNHGLQQDADSWQEFCKMQCEERNIAFKSETLSLKLDGNIEELARQARFSVFEAHAEKGDLLLLAHHANDQAETMLYRLFRGAGVTGLAAMQSVIETDKLTIVRPLLCVSKKAITSYAKSESLQWVEDGSNQDQSFDRNYIRSTVLPTILNRWPSAVERINKTASFLSEAKALLAELAESDFSLHRGANDQSLSLSGFAALSLPRQKNLIRYWCSLNNIRISEKGLDELIRSVINAGDDKMPSLLIEGKTVQRFKEQLFIQDGVNSFEPFTWNCNSVCLIEGVGGFQVQGVNVDSLEVCLREGGERISVPGAVNSKTLKNWLHEQAIPPWQRKCLPLFYYRGQLVAVADLLVTKEGVSLLGENFSIEKS